MDIPVDVALAIVASVPGVYALWQGRNKTHAETKKAEAETESIHAQVADRWAEHVSELQDKVDAMRSEMDAYRNEIAERDLIISDLKDWARRLVEQLGKHAPDIKPEEYRCLRCLVGSHARHESVVGDRSGASDSVKANRLT